MFNYAARSNHDGTQSLPDRVLVTGTSTRSKLIAWGLPKTRTAIGGALRMGAVDCRPKYHADAPIFVALPFDKRVAKEMLAAVASAATLGFRFLIKDHPVFPFPFPPTYGLERTAEPLGEQTQLSRVLFAATTVGLEALTMGLPTVRFIPAKAFAIDVVPEALMVPIADADSLASILGAQAEPIYIEPNLVFTKPAWDQWKKELRIGASPCPQT